MARYLDADQAAADGFRIVHEPERQRFVLLQAADSGPGPAGPAADRILGEAHYRLFGSEAEGTAGIDFDHTYVDPSQRGTGLSGVLAQHALTDEIVRGRRVSASCWFIARYLRKHPELAG